VVNCPSCSRPVAPDAERCLSCESDLGLATRTVTPRADWIRDLPQFPPGKNFGGRFTIVELVARGGMSVVYKAIDRELGSDVALKILPPELAARPDFVERFRREVRVTRQINHPNVCRVFDLGVGEGALYFSMEWVKGETVRDLLRHTGKLPEGRALEIAEKVARALEAAHERGVIHRDLKPSNVLVGERGMVKIIDFGLATTAVGDGLTATGAILGTPHYMAPEQVRGKPVDIRSDIYALGALAYHLVCGRPPFAGDNPIAIGFAHLSEAVTPPSQLRRDVPAGLEAAILAALAKAPEDRPASARAFIDKAFGAAA
jgi:serine/threonine protein kinase